MKLWLWSLSFLLTANCYATVGFFAHGDYLSTQSKGWPVKLKINRRGYIKSEFPLTIPQGARVAISFPHPLGWNSESEYFTTTGWFAVKMGGQGMTWVCRYPVKLDASFLEGALEADITLSFSQRYFFQNGRCTREGEAETFHIFRRVK